MSYESPVQFALRLLRPVYVAVSVILLASFPLLAEAANQANIADMLNSVRHRCAADSRPNLRVNALLMKAAIKVMKGAKPADAAHIAGYEMTQLASIHLQGVASDTEMLDALATQSCKIIADADSRDFGYYWRNNEIWILIGAARGDPGKPAIAVRRALALVNEVRARGYRCGTTDFPSTTALKLNLSLIKAAQSHADEMATFRYVEHEGKDGSTPASRAAKAGYSWKVVGENVAAGEGTVDLVIEDWLGSPHHCENIMDPRFTEMGIAFSVNNRDQQYGVYWTQTFGKPKAK